MIALTSKHYYTDDEKAKPKISCKGVRKKQNSMSWQRYLEAPNGSIDTATNTGFWVCEQGIKTCTEDLGLSAYKQRSIPMEFIQIL